MSKTEHSTKAPPESPHTARTVNGALATTLVLILSVGMIWQLWQLSDALNLPPPNGQTLAGFWATQLSLIMLLHIGCVGVVAVKLALRELSFTTLMCVMLIMLCLPLAGPLLILCMLTGSPKDSAPAPQRDWASLNLAQLPTTVSDQAIKQSGTDAIYILKHASSTARKQHAIALADHLPLKDAVQIYRQAMLDPSDEIRLQGVSQFRRIERHLTADITLAKQEINEATTTKQRAEAALVTALRYFNMVYLEIADIALQPYYLKQAQHYCDLALNHDALADAKLLSVRLALLKQAPKRAQEILTELSNSDLPATLVRPYQAESAFALGAYAQIPEMMREFPTQSATLDKVRRFWL